MLIKRAVCSRGLQVVYIPDEPTEADPVMEKAVADALSVIKSAGVAVYTLDEIIDKGKAKPMPASPPKPEVRPMHTHGSSARAALLSPNAYRMSRIRWMGAHSQGDRIVAAAGRTSRSSCTRRARRACPRA